jgi:hypothetical protein
MTTLLTYTTSGDTTPPVELQELGIQIFHRLAAWLWRAAAWLFIHPATPETPLAVEVDVHSHWRRCHTERRLASLIFARLRLKSGTESFSATV